MLVPRATFPLVAKPSQNLFDLDNPEEWTYFQRFCSYSVQRLSGYEDLNSGVESCSKLHKWNHRFDTLPQQLELWI
jgi:hypothetical protein